MFSLAVPERVPYASQRYPGIMTLALGFSSPTLSTTKTLRSLKYFLKSELLFQLGSTTPIKAGILVIKATV